MVGIALADPNNDVTRQDDTGVFSINLSSTMSTSALPLARGDNANYTVTRFADGLGYVTSMTELVDGSLLVTSTNGSPFDPASSSRLIRLADADGNGAADSFQVLATLEGFATSVVREGALIFTTSTAQGPPTINIWRTGTTTGNHSTDPLELAGTLVFTFPAGFIHSTYALATRSSPEEPDAIELVFGVGAKADSPSTDPSLTVGLAAGSASTSFEAAQLPPDTIQRLVIRDTGSSILGGALTTIATGVRNPAGMVFAANGDLIFQDNGIDGGNEGGVPGTEKSADELNVIKADELGIEVPDFGFSEAYTAYELGANDEVISVGDDPAYRKPAVSFTRQPDGSRNEGAVEIAEAPVGFGGQYLDTIFTAFFGDWNADTNDENPVVAADLITGEQFHWIAPGVMGHPQGMLAVPNGLYISDSASVGGFNTGVAQNSSIIYRITPTEPSSFMVLPAAGAVTNAAATVSWQTSTAAITEVVISGGMVNGRMASTTHPMAIRLAPEAADPQDPDTTFAADMDLAGLDAFAPYFFAVQVGDQRREGSFRTDPGISPSLGWSQQVGASGEETGYVLLGGSDGSLFLGGDSNGNWSAPEAHGNQGETDGFVRRLDANGNPQWTHWVGTNGFDVVRGLAEGPAGSLYVSGNQGRGGYGYVQRLAITDLDSDGNPALLWQTTYTEGYNLARSVVTDPADGSAVIVGDTSAATFEGQSSNGAIDSFISKVSSDGTKLWTKVAGGSGEDFGMKAAVAADGLSYYMVGYTDVGGQFDAFLNEYSLEGSLIASRTFGTSADDFAESIAVDATGVVVAMSTDGHLFGLTNAGQRDAALVKFDAEGNFLWGQIHGTAGEEEARDLTIAADGSIFLTGHTGRDLPSGAPGLGGMNTFGGEDVFVTKFSPSGQKLWTHTTGTTGQDVGWGVVETTSGRIAVAGQTAGSLPEATSYGGQDAFLFTFEGEGGGDPDPLPTIAEYGTLALNHNWTAVNLSGTYTNPVVIATDPGRNGADPATVRIRNVGADSFEIRLQEPNYKDGNHVKETVSWMVMEAGTHRLADGTLLSAGTTTTNLLSPQGFKTVGFTAPFAGTPTVLSQTQTFNGPDWVITRTDAITGSGFQVTMQEEEKLNNGGHAGETIGWLAIDQGSANDGDTLLQAATTADVITDNPSGRLLRPALHGHAGPDRQAGQLRWRRSGQPPLLLPHRFRLQRRRRRRTIG